MIPAILAARSTPFGDGNKASRCEGLVHEYITTHYQGMAHSIHAPGRKKQGVRGPPVGSVVLIVLLNYTHTAISHCEGAFSVGARHLCHPDTPRHAMPGHASPRPATPRSPRLPW